MIQAHPECDTLIIDLRRHPGGYSLAMEYVREYVSLLQIPSIKQSYVITDGYTASGAIACIDLFRDALGAVTVGEPTGQFTAFFAFNAPLNIRLPRSQLEINVANEWVEGTYPERALYDENGKLYAWENTVLPDVFVTQDVEDLRQGRDSVLQWILEQ